MESNVTTAPAGEAEPMEAPDSKHADTKPMQIRIKGKPVNVPSICIENRTVLALGKWIRTAVVHDENWVEGDVIKNPEAAVDRLKKAGFKADVFTFSQKFPDIKPRYGYRMEWDNVAAIPLSTYSDWWEKRLPQESRKNVRRGGRRGVVAQTVSLDDKLVQGITEIYNETPFRQGKRFPKYGMDFAAVKADVSQILERSEFIGAYFGDELIGFVKLVYIGKVASILSINSKNQHFDKRPTNILMAKAVEISCEKGMTHLLYGRYTYGNKASSPLTEFKRRNGFEKVLVPRFYIPLTVKGRIFLLLNLHRGLLGLLPTRLVDFLVKMRALFLKKTLKGDAKARASEPDGKEAGRQSDGA
jgi:hypothetical protein